MPAVMSATRDAVGADIGALVVEEFVLEAEDAPIARRPPTRSAMALLARMIGGHQMLAPVLDPFDRPPEPQRGEADQHILGIKLAANAEAAADMPLDTDARRSGCGRAICASRSRVRCGTLAAPCSSRISRTAS